jgi:hypothetical protein|tara:strand:- start:566 stop:844 length:279 start_codon:yes stop_codon:yes gene_type:complete
MGIEEFLNNPKFLDSTSNGLKLRMAFLTEVIKMKKATGYTWKQIKPQIEIIINSRFPVSSRKKQEYFKFCELHYNLQLDVSRAALIESLNDD